MGGKEEPTCRECEGEGVEEEEEGMFGEKST